MSYIVELIDPLTDPRWDQFVESHPFGTIYHTSSWMEVIELSFKHIKGQVVALKNDDSQIVAGLPIYVVESWLTGRRIVSAPFATVFDPLISGEEELRMLLDALMKLYEEKRCKYIEINVKNTTEFFGEYHTLNVEMYFKRHYLILSNPKELKKTFHRTCIRRNINRSLKYGLGFSSGETNFHLKQFLHLYSQTRKRLGLPIQPFGFFDNLLRILLRKKRVSIFLVQKDRHYIASVVALKYKDTFSLEYLGYDVNFNNFYPTQFLYWNVIQQAYANGYRILDFGRTSIDNQGLLTFKKRWGTYEEDLPKIYYPEWMGNFSERRAHSVRYKILNKVFRIIPVAISTHISRLLYHHMG